MCNRAAFFLFVIILFTFGSCSDKSSNSLKNDREISKLKGNVKSVSEINYSGAGKCLTNILFNRNGYITQQESFNPDGSLIRRWVYTYDPINHPVTRKCWVQKDSLSYTMYYYYNANNKLTSTKLIKSNGILGTLDSIRYDTKLNTLFEQNFGENNLLGNSLFKKFNDRNEVIEELYTEYIVHSQGKFTYKYNSKHLQEEVSSWTNKETLVSRIHTTYFEDNNIKKTESYNSANVLVSTVNYNYDKEGNLIKILELFPDNKIKNISTYNYQYDKEGNWTSFFGYVNNKLEIIMTRKLEYY
jgi:nuclear transport factor 2 (NTF2) superfamily protein